MISPPSQNSGVRMQREIALVYSRNARPAGSGDGQLGHYAPGEAKGARPVAGVTEFNEPEVVPVVSCSATTRAGNPCKAHPVGGSDLCIGHSKQVRAEQ
jgi:hypothetical protein